MIKYTLISLVIIGALFGSINVHAQLGIGGGLNYTKHFGDFSKGTAGFHTRFFFNSSEALTISFGFTHSLPMSYQYDETANALHPATQPQQINVVVKEKYRFNSYFLRSDFYFIQDNEENFGFYFPAGINYTAAKAIITNSEYNRTRYEKIQEGVVSFGALVMNFGLGLQIKKRHTSIFVEGLLGIPATHILGAEVVTNVPIHVVFNIGLKYHFLDY